VTVYFSKADKQEYQQMQAIYKNW